MRAMMHRMAGRFYLGTSGFAYDEWRKGVWYPEDLKKDDMLDYYSTQLSSVEVNYTFRRFPSEKTVEKWRSKAADGFVFTLKASQRITHWKKLQHVEEDVRDFVTRGKLLGDRFGCVLFQCPPSLAYDAALLDELPRDAAGRRTRLRDGVPARLVVGCSRPTPRSRGRLVRRGDRREGPLSGGSVLGARRLSAPAQDGVFGRGAPGVGRADPARARRRCHDLLLLQARGRGREPEDGEATRGDARGAAEGDDARRHARRDRVDRPTAEVPATAGKTQYFTATSIDGYIADPDNSLDWLFQAHDDAHGEGRWDAFIGAVGAMAMGATTYEWVLEHEKLLDEPAKWHEFYGDIPAWVFTHRELPAIPDADMRFVKGEVAPSTRR